MRKQSREGLERWTPVRLRWQPEPMVEWADLRGHRLDAPFFEQMLSERRKAGCATANSGIDALRRLDAAPSLDPCLIIAQFSRCGSTLLSRLIGAVEGTLVICEPRILGEVAARSLEPGADAETVDILRRVVRALGRVRFGDERRFVLKLTGTLMRFVPLFRAAFPAARFVWLQREPLEVVESNLKMPSEWIEAQLKPEMSLERFTIRRLATLLLAAQAHADENTLVLDYRDLPDAAWMQVAPLLGVEVTDELVRRMRDVAGHDAKTGRPFRPRERSTLSSEALELVERSLGPLYRSLDMRRAARQAG